ncbi:MAG TPA: hypothetical protein VK615_06785 [Candidatus Binatia bacterium]|nr:hypothetical protein [Candidatus Binatia bacterium]
MKIQKILQLAIIALCLLLSKTAAATEDSVKIRDGSPPPEVFDLSFAGGTVQEFVAEVEKAFERSIRGGQRPNFIVPPESSSLKVPKLELRSVDTETLMNAVSTLLGPREHVWRRAGRSTWIFFTEPDRRTTQAFFVGHLLKKFKIEDVTTAIDTVWQMAPSTKTDLKYHKDTQLLIIRADKPQLETASNVLLQLRDALAIDAGNEQTPNSSKKR